MAIIDRKLAAYFLRIDVSGKLYLKSTRQKYLLIKVVISSWLDTYSSAFSTIRTRTIVPVDLNSILCAMERLMGVWYGQAGKMILQLLSHLRFGTSTEIGMASLAWWENEALIVCLCAIYAIQATRLRPPTTPTWPRPERTPFTPSSGTRRWTCGATTICSWTNSAPSSTWATWHPSSPSPSAPWISPRPPSWPTSWTLLMWVNLSVGLNYRLLVFL